MEENKTKWIKRIGIAGFLFFLIKGIMWLIFGAAAWKWIKDNLFVTAIFLLFNTFTVYGQTTIIKKYNLNLTGNLYIPELNLPDTKPVALFCKWENHFQKKINKPIYFRLGSMEYTNRMEGKENVYFFK